MGPEDLYVIPGSPPKKARTSATRMKYGQRKTALTIGEAFKELGEGTESKAVGEERESQRGRYRKATNARVESKKSRAPANIPNRPQTRAWTRVRQGTTETVTTQGPSKPTQPACKEFKYQELRNRTKRAVAAKSLAASVQIGNSSEGRQSENRVPTVLAPDSRKVLELQQLQNLEAWLKTVQREVPAVSDRVDNASVTSSGNEPEKSIETSSSASRASYILSDGVSTPKPGADIRKAQKAILNKLRTRRAVPDIVTTDTKTEHFKSTFGFQKPLNIPFKDTKTLQTILTDFLQRCENTRPTENSYTAIEDLSNKINKWKLTVNLSTITNQDFESDVTHCQTSNKAVFQRTLMISIVNRWHLGEIFDFNCEGQWSLQGTFPLPSTQGLKDKVIGPKPDLAIFFKLEALTGKDTLSFSAPVPPKLESCIWPDNHFRRCFPFVFIEAKEGLYDLTFAVYANMHSASQALFNIYQWMEKAGYTDSFFEDVRLFSIAINAEKIIARVHRASPLVGEEGLVFLYDELCTLYRYTRDDASLLIRSILVEYGVAKLHGILKRTFEKVSSQQREATS